MHGLAERVSKGFDNEVSKELATPVENTMMTHSLDTLPGAYESQSTFPLLSSQSGPRIVTNSSCVMAGGSRRITSFSPSFCAFGFDGFGASL